MTNCLFYSLFFTLFLNISVGSLKFSQIHRTFMSIYKGMFEACAVSVDRNGEPIDPYYNPTEMKNYIDSYFKENLSKYTKSYNVAYKYLSDDDSVCKIECRKVEIRLTAKINTFYEYDKRQVFTIVDGDNL